MSGRIGEGYFGACLAHREAVRLDDRGRCHVCDADKAQHAYTLDTLCDRCEAVVRYRPGQTSATCWSCRHIVRPLPVADDDYDNATREAEDDWIAGQHA